MQPTYAATPTEVLDDPDVIELSVAASTDYFAWTANSEARRRRFNAYVRPIGGGDAVRVNPRHTLSYFIGIDGSMVVYSVARRGNEDLALYDPATEGRRSLP